MAEEDQEPQTGRTYRLSFKDHPHWLIGSTTTRLSTRKAVYWNNAISEERTTPVYQLIREVGREGFDITEIDYHVFNDIKKLREAEQALIYEHRDDLETPYCLNIKAAVREDSFGREACRRFRKSEKGQMYFQNYEATHKEERAENNRRNRARRAAKKAELEINGAAPVDGTPV